MYWFADVISYFHIWTAYDTELQDFAGFYSSQITYFVQTEYM